MLSKLIVLDAKIAKLSLAISAKLSKFKKKDQDLKEELVMLKNKK